MAVRGCVEKIYSLVGKLLLEDVVWDLKSMTGRNEENNEEKSISTEVDEEERAETEEKEENERKEEVRLEKLEVQLEEDSDLLQSERDNNLPEEQSQDKEGRQDEDCPFCDYMRLGPCGKSFSTWEKCTEMAEEDGSNVFEKCNVVTGILTTCMRANLSYYGPVLEAQKVIDDPLVQAEAMVEPEGSGEKNPKTTADLKGNG